MSASISAVLAFLFRGNNTRPIYLFVKRPFTMTRELEVERKFRFNPETENLLKAAGGEFVGTKELRDHYHDSSENTLMRRDMWLRLRNGQWQLKYWPNVRGPRSERSTCQYIETSDEAEIVSLMKIPLKCEGTSASTVDELVVSGVLSLFCKLVTKRRIWRLEDTTVVLDVVDGLDACIGEIEAMVKSEDEVASAVEKIDNVAAKLGVHLTKNEYGKMCLYIAKNHPELLEDMKDFLL